MIKKIALALLLALAFGAGVSAAPTFTPTMPPRFPVGARPVDSLLGLGHVFAATAPGGTLTASRDTVCIRADGMTSINLVYANAGGTQLHSRTLVVPADRSQVIDTFSNTVLATPSPPVLNNAISTFTSQLDTLIGNAASAGKLNP